MTMQPATTTGGQYRPVYTRKTSTPIKGNYRRVHEALLKYADKDGVFQSTLATKKIMADLNISKSAASSAIFQWSDPTGTRGYRRARLLTARSSSSDPAELPDYTPAPKPAQPAQPVQSWPEKAYSTAPQTNKSGPFYIPQHSGVFRGERRAQMARELLKFQKTHGGFWGLREGVEHLANLGFNSTSAYSFIRKAVEDGGCDRKGWRRWLNPDYVAELTIDLEDEQVPGGVEPETRDETEYLQSTEANKERLLKSIDDFRTEPVIQPQFHAEPPCDELRQKVEALVENTLSAPETIRAIDKLVGEAILASAKRQLGVG